MDPKLSDIRIGHKTFLSEGGGGFGAVRRVAPGGRDEIVIYVENAGDFVVSADCIRAAHDAKVILDPDTLDEALRNAIEHAHDSEVRGL